MGLNDKTAEGTTQWSGGSQLTYQPSGDLRNTDDKDCGLFVKISEGESAWIFENCQANATFICKIQD
jgi:hypothetical protein